MHRTQVGSSESRATIRLMGPWFPVSQPNARYQAEGRRLIWPFYAARVLDTWTGRYIPLASSAPLTGFSSVRRAIKYGIERYEWEQWRTQWRTRK